MNSLSPWHLISLGIDETNSECVWDVCEDPHLLIAGGIARGKRSIKETILDHCLRHPATWQVFSLGLTPTPALAQSLPQLRALIDRPLDRRGPATLIVLDDSQPGVNPDPHQEELDELIEQIVRAGGTNRIHLVLSTTNLDIYNPYWVGRLISARYTAGPLDPISSQALFGTDLATQVPSSLPGYGAFRSGALAHTRILRSPYLRANALSP